MIPYYRALATQLITQIRRYYITKPATRRWARHPKKQ